MPEICHVCTTNLEMPGMLCLEIFLSAINDYATTNAVCNAFRYTRSMIRNFGTSTTYLDAVRFCIAAYAWVTWYYLNTKKRLLKVCDNEQTPLIMNAIIALLSK